MTEGRIAVTSGVGGPVVTRSGAWVEPRPPMDYARQSRSRNRVLNAPPAH